MDTLGVSSIFLYKVGAEFLFLEFSPQRELLSSILKILGLCFSAISNIFSLLFKISLLLTIALIQSLYLKHFCKTFDPVGNHMSGSTYPEETRKFKLIDSSKIGGICTAHSKNATKSASINQIKKNCHSNKQLATQTPLLLIQFGSTF